MPDEQIELGKKLATYADAITAFSFVQSVAFGVALGSNEALARNATKIWWLIPLALVAANILYGYLILECHRGEDVLVVKTGAAQVRKWLKKIRRWRISIVVLGLFLSLGAFTLTWQGSGH